MVAAALDGLAAGDLEIVVDETAAAKTSLTGDPHERFPHLAASSIDYR